MQMRGWLRDARSYLPPVKIGEVMRSGGVGQVIKSNDAAFKEGDWVSGTLGWQQYAQVPAKGLEKISVDSKTSPSLYLGVLGMPGMLSSLSSLILDPQANVSQVRPLIGASSTSASRKRAMSVHFASTKVTS